MNSFPKFIVCLLFFWQKFIQDMVTVICDLSEQSIVSSMAEFLKSHSFHWVESKSCSSPKKSIDTRDFSLSSQSEPSRGVTFTVSHLINILLRTQKWHASSTRYLNSYSSRREFHTRRSIILKPKNANMAVISWTTVTEEVMSVILETKREYEL